jgi:high-affinity iron transporter
MPVVWMSVLLAVAWVLFVGAGLQMLAAEFPQKQQELFEAVVAMIAVAMLTYMVFWMCKAANTMKRQLSASLESTFVAGRGQGVALVLLVFVAVAREGLESVFFLLAVFQQSDGWSALLGALLGIGAAVVIGVLIFKGGLRLDLQRFFYWTGLFILVVAAGLFAGIFRALHEAGLWNHLQTVVVDLSSVLAVDSLLGTLLSGLLGYRDDPRVGELLAYASYLCVALFFFLRGRRPSAVSYQPSQKEAGLPSPHIT